MTIFGVWIQDQLSSEKPHQARNFLQRSLKPSSDGWVGYLAEWPIMLWIYAFTIVCILVGLALLAQDVVTRAATRAFLAHAVLLLLGVLLFPAWIYARWRLARYFDRLDARFTQNPDPTSAPPLRI